MQVLGSELWLGSRELRRTCTLGSGLTKKDLRLSMMAAFWICVRGKSSAMVVLCCVEPQQWPQPSVPWGELALRGVTGGAQCALEDESRGCLAAPSQSRVVPSSDRGDGGQRGWWWCRAGVWQGMTLAGVARRDGLWALACIRARKSTPLSIVQHWTRRQHISSSSSSRVNWL